MIVLSASTTADRKTATDAARDAIVSLGGTVTEVQHLARDACSLHFELSAFGLPALGAFLGASGLTLDPESEIAMSGYSAGVHVMRARGILHVRFGEGNNLGDDGVEDEAG